MLLGREGSGCLILRDGKEEEDPIDCDGVDAVFWDLVRGEGGRGADLL